MDRRRFLRDGALAGATLMGGSALGLLSGCTSPAPRRAPTPMLRHDYVAPETSFIETACNLPPVRVSADREIRTVVGLRPFRRNGFRVEAETIGDTLIVHNYGHGGGGITLSWGTSKLAVDLVEGRSGPAAVIGCGIEAKVSSRGQRESIPESGVTDPGAIAVIDLHPRPRNRPEDPERHRKPVVARGGHPPCGRLCVPTRDNEVFARAAVVLQARFITEHVPPLTGQMLLLPDRQSLPRLLRALGL